MGEEGRRGGKDVQGRAGRKNMEKGEEGEGQDGGK